MRIFGRHRDRPSLRRTANALTLSTALLVSASVGALHWALHVVGDRLTGVIHARQCIAQAYAVARSAALVQGDRAAHLLIRDSVTRATYDRAVDDFRRNLAALSEAVAGNPGQADRVARIGELFEGWRRGEEGLDADRSLPTSRRQGFMAQIATFDALQGTLDDLVAVEASGVDSGTRASNELIRSIDLGAMVATLAVLASLGLAVLLLSRRVLTPLAELTATAQAISGGDLDRRTPVHRPDELGSLATSFNAMTEQLDGQRRQDAMLRELREVMHGVVDLDEAAQILALLVPECLPRSSGRLYLLDPAGEQLVPRGGWAIAGEGRTFPASSCWALRLGRVYEVSAERRNVPCTHVPDPSRATMCIPLGARGGLIGLLEVTFDGRAPRGVTEIGETLSLALANVRAQEQMRDEAERDELTGVYNRRHLDRALAQELRAAEQAAHPLAVVLVDVDQFKHVNDVHGHAAGDALLRALAASLRASCRGSDVVGRYGGDEFLAILPSCSAEDGLARAEAIRAAVQALRVQHGALALESVTISVGVAAYPTDARDARTLLALADQALYASKSQGRNRVTGSASRSADPPAGA
jgi:diguanylate cyclase (GGDEF)-like protein